MPYTKPALSLTRNTLLQFGEFYHFCWIHATHFSSCHTFPESEVVAYKIVKKFMIWNNAFFNCCDAQVSCENYVNSDEEDNLISPLVWISNMSMWKKILPARQQSSPLYHRKLTLSINFWSFSVFSSRNFSLSCWAFICFSSCFFLDSAIVLLTKPKKSKIKLDNINWQCSKHFYAISLRENK